MYHTNSHTAQAGSKFFVHSSITRQGWNWGMLSQHSGGPHIRVARASIMVDAYMSLVLQAPKGPTRDNRRQPDTTRDKDTGGSHGIQGVLPTWNWRETGQRLNVYKVPQWNIIHPVLKGKEWDIKYFYTCIYMLFRKQEILLRQNVIKFVSTKLAIQH